MATATEWLRGARPRTLPAAIAPVAVGTGIAIGADAGRPTRALLALVVAVALQVGANFANDYSDGVRGTDAVRVGPVRLVGQGLADAGAVRRAAIASFAVAAAAGLILVALVGAWWLLAVGAAAIAAAWFYTGGPRPYGYAGLGEAFVLVFFGLVPVAFTAYVQTGTLDALSWAAGLGVGCLASAVLVANNLRDIPSDRDAGKVTLAVRLGDRATRVLYIALVVAAFAVVAAIAIGPGLGITTAWLALLAVPLAVRPVLDVSSGAVGAALVGVLQSTGLLLLAYGLLLGAGLALGTVVS